jgi:uncharacterized coiled-coil protein SlyX
MRQLEKWLKAHPIMEIERRIVELEIELAQWRSAIAVFEELRSKS